MDTTLSSISSLEEFMNTRTKQNPQVRRTKEWLRSSIISLLREKPLYDISINELVENANLSRSAFYNHYSSKSEILAEYAEELYLNYIATVFRSNTKTQFENWKLLLSHYYEAREFYVLVYDNNLSSLIYDTQIKNRHYMISAIEKTIGYNIVDKELYYNIFVPYHRRAELEYTLSWLKNGAKESIDEMAQLFSSLSSIDAFEHFRLLYSRHDDSCYN